MTLFLARRHGVDWDHQGKLHVWSNPTVEGEASIFVIDVFHADADATGYSQSQELAPEVEVLSLDCGDGVLRAVLRLREDQRVALELPDATVDVAWPQEQGSGAELWQERAMSAGPASSVRVASSTRQTLAPC
jgi:hypothetical protein